MTLLVIAIVSCCGDYGSATGSIAIVPQAGQWHISPNTVNHVSIPGARVFQVPCTMEVVVFLWSYHWRFQPLKLQLLLQHNLAVQLQSTFYSSPS